VLGLPTDRRPMMAALTLTGLFMVPHEHPAPLWVAQLAQPWARGQIL